MATDYYHLPTAEFGPDQFTPEADHHEPGGRFNRMLSRRVPFASNDRGYLNIRGPMDVNVENHFHDSMHSLAPTAFATAAESRRVFVSAGTTPGTQAMLQNEYPGYNGIVRLSTSVSTNSRAQMVWSAGVNATATNGYFFNPGSANCRITTVVRFDPNASSDVGAGTGYQIAIGASDVHTGTATTQTTVNYAEVVNGAFLYVNSKVAGVLTTILTNFPVPFGTWCELEWIYEGIQRVTVLCNGVVLARIENFYDGNAQNFYHMVIRSGGAGTGTALRTLDIDDMNVWHVYGRRLY